MRLVRALNVHRASMLFLLTLSGVVNYIAMDEQKSTSLIKAVAGGMLAPGVSLLKTLYLTTTGAPGDRVVDISVQSQTAATSALSPTVGSPMSPNTPIPVLDRTETLRTITIGAVRPLSVEHKVVYRRPLRPQPGLADLSRFDGTTRDEASAVEALVTSTWTVAAPSGLVIDGIALVRKVNPPGRCLESLQLLMRAPPCRIPTLPM